MGAAAHAHAEIGIEHGTGGLVFDQNQAAHKTAGLGIPDQSMRRERLKLLGQIRARVLAHPARQVFFFHQVQVGQGHRAGHGVPAVGVAVVELAAFFNQNIGHAVAHHDATQRDVAAGHALGKGHQVGLVAKLFVGKPMAQTAKRANDFVRNQQDAVLVHDALDLWPVGLGRDDHAACALHGLTNEGRDLLRANGQNLLF